MNEITRDVVCTISVENTSSECSQEEFFELRRDMALFMQSVGARVMLSPLAHIKDENKMTTTFEINSGLQPAVEDYYYLTEEMPKHFTSSISFDRIEPLNEPALGVFIV